MVRFQPSRSRWEDKERMRKIAAGEYVPGMDNAEMEEDDYGNEISRSSGQNAVSNQSPAINNIK